MSRLRRVVHAVQQQGTALEIKALDCLLNPLEGTGAQERDQGGRMRCDSLHRG
jgi:hypothetical protein